MEKQRNPMFCLLRRHFIAGKLPTSSSAATQSDGNNSGGSRLPHKCGQVSFGALPNGATFGILPKFEGRKAAGVFFQGEEHQKRVG